MSNFIEDLFYGNIEPQESKTHITKLLKAKLNKMTEKEERLRNELSEDTLKIFNEYVDMSNEFSCLSCLDSFISGFRIGSKFTYDTFVDN